MNFRPLPRRTLPAIGFLAAVQMASQTAVAADNKVERKADSMAASASATAHRMGDKAANAADRAGDKAAAAAEKTADKASEVVTKASTAIKGTPAHQRWERTHRATKIVGTDVRNRKGEKIGDVKDIVLDDKGAVAYAIVSTGGFLGIGDRLHAVPWSALNIRTDKDFQLDIDKATLQKAPGFGSRDWPDFDDAQWQSNNRRHYRDWVDGQ
ncbi:MAG: PRC-barrel domain-containing protein [Aquabacterium sp.]